MPVAGTDITAAKLWPWLRLDSISQRYGPPNENGIDIALPMHTPITSLTEGTIISTGWYGGGGVVCVRSSGIPGLGVASVYYQHLDEIDVHESEVVNIGDRIGLSGGQLHGGFHPVTCCSTGPHMEVGLNPPGGAHSLWRPLGPNINPLPWLQGLAAHGANVTPLPAGTGALTGGNDPVATVSTAATDAFAGLVHPSGPTADAWADIWRAIDKSMEFTWATPSSWLDMPTIAGDLVANIKPLVLRGMVMLLGFLIILLCISNLIKGAVEAAAPLAVEAAAMP
jgi:hypothetical protein